MQSDDEYRVCTAFADGIPQKWASTPFPYWQNGGASLTWSHKPAPHTRWSLLSGFLWRQKELGHITTYSLLLARKCQGVLHEGVPPSYHQCALCDPSVHVQEDDSYLGFSQSSFFLEHSHLRVESNWRMHGPKVEWWTFFPWHWCGWGTE